MGGNRVRQIEVLDVEHLVGGVGFLALKLETTDLVRRSSIDAFRPVTLVSTAWILVSTVWTRESTSAFQVFSSVKDVVWLSSSFLIASSEVAMSEICLSASIACF